MNVFLSENIEFSFGQAKPFYHACVLDICGINIKFVQVCA